MVVLGIDLGTTNSCVAVFHKGSVEILVNDDGDRTTPSVVAFDGDETLVGKSAKQMLGFNPENTIYDAKRVLGKRFNDDTIAADMKLWPFKVIEHEDKPAFQVIEGGELKIRHPEQISAMVLMKMKQIAQTRLGTETKIEGAVITVPAYFNTAQRQATKDAGIIAGLRVLNIISEPTAAAFAYGHKNAKMNKTILVYDLGGGTFDVSIVEIKNQEYDVKAITGNTHLGGGDFDQLLVKHLVKELAVQYGKDISQDKQALALLKEHCELAKRTLSESNEALVAISRLLPDLNYKTRVSRATFESLCVDLFDETMQCVQKALDDAKLKKEDIDEVVLVGGSTRIPLVRQLLQNFFNGKQLSCSINPDEAVAYGAALKGAMISGGSTADMGELSQVVLRDVTPLSLGIQSGFNGAMQVVVPRNTKIPFKVQQKRLTIMDFQTEMSFCIYEGERPLSIENHFLAKFSLTGITPKRANEAAVMTTFEMDENGILKVSAYDPETENANDIEIQDSGSLTQSRVDELVREAELQSESDEEKKRRLVVIEEMEKYVRVLIPRALDAVSKADDLEVLNEQKSNTRRWLDNNAEAGMEELEAMLAGMKIKCDHLFV